MSEGKKFDDVKDPWHLVPWDAVRSVVKVLAFGSKKYTRKFDNEWLGLLSVQSVVSIATATPTGCVVLVTRDIYGQPTLSMQNASGKIEDYGNLETLIKSKNTVDVESLIHIVGCGTQRPKSITSSKRWAPHSTRLENSRLKDAPSARQQGTYTSTIVTQQGGLEESFVVDATTVLGSLMTAWKVLNERYPTLRNRKLLEISGDRNWEKGMAWSRCFSALQRHMTSWWMREGLDPETGYSHLWHAGCCIMFLIAYELRGVGEDDRPELGLHH